MRARSRTIGLRRIPLGPVVVIAALFVGPAAYGHPATERYIPIGQSPGVSYEMTTVGTVTDIDPVARTITVSSAGGATVVTVGESTRIWLDRSKIGLTSLTGTFADFVDGATVEVKLIPGGGQQDAEWIKIESRRR